MVSGAEGQGGGRRQYQENGFRRKRSRPHGRHVNWSQISHNGDPSSNWHWVTLLEADYFAIGKIYLRDEKNCREVIFKISIVQNSINFLIRKV